MSLTFLEKLEAIGEAKGRVEGRAKGRAESKQDMVLLVLRKRFTKIPAKIETAIREIKDPIAIESLCVHALSCQTLKEFTADLE